MHDETMRRLIDGFIGVTLDGAGSAATCTNASAEPTTLTLEAINEMIAELGNLAHPIVYFAKQRGFDLLNGDMMILPLGSGIDIPSSLRAAVKESPLVTDLLLIKGGASIVRMPYDMKIEYDAPHWLDSTRTDEQLWAVWPDGTYCESEIVGEMTHLSDDYAIVYAERYEPDGTPVFDKGLR